MHWVGRRPASVQTHNLVVRETTWAATEPPGRDLEHVQSRFPPDAEEPLVEVHAGLARREQGLGAIILGMELAQLCERCASSQNQLYALDRYKTERE